MAHDISENLDPDCGCVIASFDLHLSYIKLMKAASYLERPGVIFLATNTDERFPLSEQCSIPGKKTIENFTLILKASFLLEIFE